MKQIEILEWESSSGWERASSAESVGDLWFGEGTEGVIQREFDGVVVATPALAGRTFLRLFGLYFGAGPANGPSTRAGLGGSLHDTFFR